MFEIRVVSVSQVYPLSKYELEHLVSINSKGSLMFFFSLKVKGISFLKEGREKQRCP